MNCGHIYHERCLRDALEVGHTRCSVCRMSIDCIRVAPSRAGVGNGYRAFVAPIPFDTEAFDIEAYFLRRQRGGDLPVADSRLAVLATVTRSLPPLEPPGSDAAGPNNYVFVLDISCEWSEPRKLAALLTELR